MTRSQPAIREAPARDVESVTSLPSVGEVGLVEQAIAPHIRRAGGNRDVQGEVTQLVISFHAALVRTAMER